MRTLFPALWLAACLACGLLLPGNAVLAQTGLEGRDYRHPGAQPKERAAAEVQPEESLPVIAYSSLDDLGLRYELTVRSDGTWYFITGAITNLGSGIVELSYVNPNALPYFRIQSGDQEVWTTKPTGPCEQAFVTHRLQSAEQRIYDAVWKGQNRRGYSVEPGPLFIQFVPTHQGRTEGVIACRDVPLLATGTGWLPPELQGNAAPDGWFAASLGSLMADGLLPGYPANYFTRRAQPGRSMALAIALLNSAPVWDTLTEDQARRARELAGAVGL
jgi:hypothetical protein